LIPKPRSVAKKLTTLRIVVSFVLVPDFVPDLGLAGPDLDPVLGLVGPAVPDPDLAVLGPVLADPGFGLAGPAVLDLGPGLAVPDCFRDLLLPLMNLILTGQPWKSR